MFSNTFVQPYIIAWKVNSCCVIMLILILWIKVCLWYRYLIFLQIILLYLLSHDVFFESGTQVPQKTSPRHSHVPHTHMSPTPSCPPHPHVPHTHRSPSTHVPDTHLSPTPTCPRHPHVPDTHMSPTPTCPPHPHVPDTQFSYIFLYFCFAQIYYTNVVGELRVSPRQLLWIKHLRTQ